MAIDKNISLAQKIHAGILLDIPIFLWGSPGIGKTTSVYDVCNHLNMDCLALVANTYEPTYFGGYPFVKDDDILMAKPQFIKDLEQYVKPVALFMDEFPTTPRATQNSLLRVTFERKAGKWHLNANTRIIAAGNFVDVAGNTIISPAMANRFLHVFHTPQVDEWIGSLSGNVPLTFKYEENWKQDIKFYESVIIDFAETYFKSNPSYFADMPSRIETTADYAFSTPRSLTAAAKVLALLYISDIRLCKELLKGCIGSTTSAALIKHIGSKTKLDKFPDIDVEHYKFSSDPSQVTVLIRSASMYAAEEQYVEKAIALFNKAHADGFVSPVLKYGETLAKNVLQKSGHARYKEKKNFIKDLPFMIEVFSAGMRK